MSKVQYYFSLVSKETGKEVYTSPAYLREDGVEVFNWYKILDVFKFYLDRVNSGITSQMSSPKTSPEDKAKLRLLEPSMFKMVYMSLENNGGYSSKAIWSKELADFSEMKQYRYSPQT